MQEKIDNYEVLVKQTSALVEGEHDLIANMANLSALLFHTLPNVNWVGFYLSKQNELILGPFQGNVACVHIPFGKGVCGTCATMREVLLVDNVHAFPGHIACDTASNSEIVLPIIKEDTLLGVLDIDSVNLSNFDSIDLLYLSQIVEVFIQSL